METIDREFKRFLSYSENEDTYSEACYLARRLIQHFTDSLLKTHGVKANVETGDGNRADLIDMIDECYNNNLISYNSQNAYHRIRMLTNPVIHSERNADKCDINEITGLLTQEYHNYMNAYGGIKIEQISMDEQLRLHRKKRKEEKKRKREYVANKITAITTILFGLVSLVYVFINRRYYIGRLLGERFVSLNSDGFLWDVVYNMLVLMIPWLLAVFLVQTVVNVLMKFILRCNKR